MIRLKKVVAALMSASILLSTTVQAQIPTTDIAALTQAIQQVMAWKEQYDQMTEQLENAESQLQTQKDMLSKLTGPRGLGSAIAKMTEQELPDSWTGDVDSLLDGVASSEARAIWNQLKVSGCDKYTGDVLQACEAQALVAPETSALMTKAVKASQKRQKDLEGLLSRIDSTQDVKESTDLVARIQVEAAKLQNEYTMMAMAETKLRAQQQINDRQLQERMSERLKKSDSQPFDSAWKR